MPSNVNTGYVPTMGTGVQANGMQAGLGAAASAIPGFGSLLGPLLLSFGPAFINKLFGKDPAKELRKRVAKLTSAQNVGKVTNDFYNQAQSSPAFSQAQGTIAAGANQAGGDLSRALGARGIGTSGSAAVLSSLTPSLVGSQMAGLRSSAYQGAQNQAQNSIQAQLAALTGSQGPSPTQSMFAGGLDAFGPIFSNFLKQRYPQFGG